MIALETALRFLYISKKTLDGVDANAKYTAENTNLSHLQQET